MQNPERINILVSVGKAHLPAFSDDYTYIDENKSYRHKFSRDY